MTDDDQASGTDEQNSDEQEEKFTKGQKAAEEDDAAIEKVQELEENPPEKLEDWPDDKAKYRTFGGAEGNESYEDSVTSKLGPSSLRHRDDGSVEIAGEKVDDPEQYKGDPIPGGPTDPAIADSRAYGEPDLTDETSVDVEGDGDGDGEKDSEAKDDSGDDSEAREQSEQPSE